LAVVKAVVALVMEHQQAVVQVAVVVTELAVAQVVLAQ
jgi:hypothetical protein